MVWTIKFGKIRQGKAAFTLIEITTVIAIIGMLAALAVPSFINARKRVQARSILNDVRLMDAAIDQWVLEKDKRTGDKVDTTEVRAYLKGEWKTSDPLGNPYKIGPVGANQVQVSSATKIALAAVDIDWDPY